MRPRIALDARLPAARGPLEAMASVVPLDSSALREADALCVASTTRVDATLLDRAPRVRWVATASSGTDHLDHAELAARGIGWGHAAGGNAQAVTDWVELVLRWFAGAPTTLGILGVGNVGSAVAERMKRLGWRCLLCDPPRAARDPGFLGVDEPTLLAEADWLTLHVPLDGSTRNLLGRAEIERFRGRGLLQASRGGTLDEGALAGLARRSVSLALDVYEGEPAPRSATLAAARFATPHIAGHTDLARAALCARAVHWLARRLGEDPARLPRVPVEAAAGAAEEVLRRADARLRAGEPFARVRPESVRRPLHADWVDRVVP